MGRHILRRHLSRAALFCSAALIASCGGSSTTVVAPTSALARCGVTVTADTPSVDWAGGGGSVNIETARECQWTAAAETSWLTVAAGAAGQGPSTVPFTAAANPLPAVRRGTITVNGQRVEITQAAAVCTIFLSTRAVSVGATGGAASVAMTTQDPCTWTAVSREGWITVTSRTSGAGSTEVVFEAAANSGVARQGIVEIAGQQVTVSQAAPALGCSFTIDPPSAAVGGTGSQTTVTVSAPSGCAWSAVSGAPWITTSSAASGTGNGSVVLQISANSGPARTADVSIAGRTFTVTQSAAPVTCTYAVTPATRSIGAGGGATTAAVVTENGCAWSTTGAPTWITVSNGNGSGNGTVTLSVENNTGATRTATVTIAGRPLVIDQEAAVPAPSCSYTLNPTAHSAPAGGGAFSVAVTTAGGCSWSTAGLPSWIASTNAGGTGTGALSLEVEANSGSARTATFTIAGRQFTVAQAAPAPAPTPACEYSLAPTSHSATAAGGTTSVGVSTSTGCTWSTTGLPSWITFTSGNGGGSGTGAVNLTVQSNSGAARSATLTIAGKSFTVNQAAGAAPTCAYAINPPSHSAPAAGGNTSVAVTTTAGCNWTTTGAPSWITFTTASGAGSGSVSLAVQANTGAARSATLTIAGQSFIVNQAAPAPSCTYAINPTSHSAPAAGGNTSVAVTTAAGCSWTTTGLPAWITFTTGTGAGTGSGAVNLTVQANTGSARSATLTIGGQSFIVNQAAPAPACSYTVTPQTFNIGDGERSGNQALLVAVGTGLQCTWTATVTPGRPWLTIRSGATGTGPGAVLIEVERNRGNARTGTLTIAGRTVTINQDEDD